MPAYRSVWAIGVILTVAPLVLVGTGGHALRNGDEAIYAQIGREAAEEGHWAVPTWQGVPQIGRPHGIGWSVGIARKLVPDERSVRWTLALACALQAALLLLLGARLFSPAAGLAAAGLLVTSDLFLGYARYLESEPFLCALALGGLLCWEKARTDKRWIVGWGLCLGGGLMVKQLIGALPLLAVAVDWLQRDRPRVRGVGWGLAAAAALWLPWHLFMLARFGRPFLDAYFLGQIVHRSSEAMHQATRPSFYLRELWRSEGLGALVAAAGIGWAVTDGLRNRRTGSLLVAGWALPVLGLFSLVASRYDYYLLLVYPALALAAGALLSKLPLRALAIGAIVLAAGIAHLPRNLSHFIGEDEMRELVRGLDRQLYLYNTHGYAARFYITAETTTLLESAEDERLAESFRNVLPSSTLYAPNLPETLAKLPRPFALVMPRARVELLPEGLELLRESKHYLLLEAR